MTNTTPPFEPLVKLLHGDPDRIRRMLGIFERVTREDLDRLDQAYASRDWAAIGELAHKVKSGCMQVGENAAADALAVLERTVPLAHEDDDFARAFAVARDALDRALMRVAGYLATWRGASE